MSQLIPAIRISAITKPAKSAVIIVHGLGDTGEGWSWFPNLVKQAKILKNPESVNYVFPNAPQIPITVNGGYVMPAWFDIYEFGNPNARQDVPGFFKSCDTLISLIKEQTEVHNIPAEKVIIGGFSQGAAISLATASLLDFKIGGVIAMSGFCPIKDDIKAKLDGKTPINAGTPVFQGHGEADPMIVKAYGEQTSEFYKSLGFTNYTFKTYSGVAHSAGDDELVDVVKFIAGIFD
ncbi:acyl-protein thioesterase 1 [Scheffersomyces amazonensis]|uniref:acyl-protein thioesterase 1 n=1 Tax=Scheffersomyces amazonensis TaxID=1078765 RepID=UPI00315D05AF